MSDMLGCAHCGAPASEPYEKVDGTWEIACLNDDCTETVWGLTLEEASANWNRRPKGMDPLDPEA